MSITEKNGLKINTKLLDFVNNEIIPSTDIKSEEFWTNFGNIVHFPSLPCLLFDLENDPNEINDLSRVKEFQDIKNELVSKLLSHRMIHQERQLSNTKLSSVGVKTNSGPSSRKME